MITLEIVDPLYELGNNDKPWVTRDNFSIIVFTSLFTALTEKKSRKINSKGALYVTLYQPPKATITKTE